MLVVTAASMRSPTYGVIAIPLVALVAFLVLPRVSWPILLVGIVAFVPSSTYGLTGGQARRTLYNLGTGKLPISPFELGIEVLAALLLITARKESARRLGPGLEFSFLCAIYLVHVLAAAASGHPLADAFTGTGGRLILLAAASYIVVSTTLSNWSQLRTFFSFVAWMGIPMAVFGLARFTVGEGDPANPYQNYSDIAVRLTYFEAAYAVVLAFSCYWFASKAVGKGASSLHSRFQNAACAGLCFLTILLSFRRTNWLSLIVGMALIYLLVQDRRSRGLGAISIFVVIVTVISLSAQRQLGPVRDRISFSVAAERDQRTREVQLALREIGKNPLGLGPLGQYSGSPGLGWPAPPSIVHNAPVWLGLKTGVPGMVLLALIPAHCMWLIRDASRRQKRFRSQPYGAVLAGFCGFWITNLLYGTPLLEARLAVLFGVWAAACYRLRLLALGEAIGQSESGQKTCA